jgi:hypothetical protein
MDEGIGKFGDEFVVGGLAGEGDGVIFGFRRISPAIEDGEDERLWAIGHLA